MINTGIDGLVRAKMDDEEWNGTGVDGRAGGEVLVTVDGGREGGEELVTGSVNVG